MNLQKVEPPAANYCMYDPVDLCTCENDPYQPPFSTCEKCLTRCVVDALSAKDESEALRWFAAYQKLHKVMMEKEGDK